MRVSFFVDHIRALNREFRLQVSWGGEPLTSATRQIFALTEGWPESPDAGGKVDEGLQPSRGSPSNGRQVDTVLLNTFRLPWLRLSRDFSSAVRRMSGNNAKTGHGPHPPSGTAASSKCLPTVACPRLRLYQSGFKPQKAFQTKYAPPTPPRIKLIKVSIFSMPSRGLQPQQKLVSVSKTPATL
jgi:hypothetical protein